MYVFTVYCCLWRGRCSSCYLTSNVSRICTEGSRAIHITNTKQTKNKWCASYSTAHHKLSSCQKNHKSWPGTRLTASIDVTKEPFYRACMLSVAQNNRIQPMVRQAKTQRITKKKRVLCNVVLKIKQKSIYKSVRTSMLYEVEQCHTRAAHLCYHHIHLHFNSLDPDFYLDLH